MSPWLPTLAAVAVASILPLAATLTLAMRPQALGAWLPQLIPFAVGSLFGAAAFHLIPEAIERSVNPLGVVGVIGVGVMVFALVDRLLHARFAAMPQRSLGQAHSLLSSTIVPPTDVLTQRTRELLPLNIAGDALHNFIDGILIASSFLLDPALGVITGAAIALHEVPRELGTFALCIRGGLSVTQAVAVNALTALVSVMGAALTLLIGTTASALGIHLLPFAAGNLLYLAGSILLVEVRGATGRRALVVIVGLVTFGVAVTALAARH